MLADLFFGLVDFAVTAVLVLLALSVVLVTGVTFFWLAAWFGAPTLIALPAAAIGAVLVSSLITNVWF